ncbi:MAG: hypothetical protein WCR20_11885 [Verrucomicrobiota bacterium]
MNLIKAHYATRPETIQDGGDGSFLFNYNILPEILPSQPGTPDREGFICSQVIISGYPTKKTAKKAVIEAEFSDDQEKKLINDFNAFSAGALEDARYKNDYLSFLDRRKEIKNMIDNEPLISEA